jgi:hypothetical protein
VTQPLEGAREHGALGLVTGIGKGIGGLVLKPGAGKYYYYLSLMKMMLIKSTRIICTSSLYAPGHITRDAQGVWYKL